MLYFENFMKTNVSTDLKMLCIYFTFKRKIGCHRRLCNIFEVFSRALPERPEYIRGVFPSSNGKAREVAIETLSCHFNYFFFASTYDLKYDFPIYVFRACRKSLRTIVCYKTVPSVPLIYYYFTSKLNLR